MEKLTRVFQIFNVLWNAGLQGDKTPEGYWSRLPEWAKEYLAEECTFAQQAKEDDSKFDPASPNLKYMTFPCLLEDDDSFVVVAWDDASTPPLRKLLVSPDAELCLLYGLASKKFRDDVEVPRLPKR